MRPFFVSTLLVMISAAGPVRAAKTDAILGDLHWREIGPAGVGGRIDDFAVLDANPDIMYVATASGGVWKTIDGGIIWKPIFEHIGPMSIGAVAVSQSNPAIVWAGTGEPNNRQSSSWGTGVYKSSDAGATWNYMGLPESHHVGRILIDPRNANTVYVAALGHLWGANEERGLYKTVDGGKTWARVLSIDSDTGVVDVKLDPQSPDTLYAAAYVRRRTPFGFNGGGPGSAIYKSNDAGASWKKLVNGLPYADGGDTGRIGLAVYRKNPKIVYAEVQHAKGGLYRSEDSGETWTKMSDVNPNPTYFSNFYIDPNNDLRIWVAALQGTGELAGVALSQDGGKTFIPSRGTKVHADFHAMWIDPANSDHAIIGVDGGMYSTRDMGLNWERLNQIAIGQAYQVGFDMAQPYHVCAGFQDNGTSYGPAVSRTVNGIHNSDWIDVLAGDGFHCQPDLADADLVYVESQDGTLLRLKLSTHEWANIVPQPKEGEEPFRFEWNAPMIISAHNPKRIFFGAQYLFQSEDRGETWRRISPDLTTGADRDKIAVLGKTPPQPILSRNYGVTWYPCITRISESPVDANVVWVGTQDGNLQVTRDGGKSWVNVADRIGNVPKGTYVSGLEASRLGAGAAYVVFDGHRSDDFRVHIYQTTDYGQTWKSVAGDLPKNAVAHVMREDPINRNLLFAGTEFGAYVSMDQGKQWALLGGNLPTVRIDDIKIHPREHDLILGTHGRALWILDDITALEQPGAPSQDSSLELFDLRPTISYRQYEISSAQDGSKLFEAPNPPYGAVITYRLKQGSKEKVPITILDKQGNTILQFDGTQTEGLNRVNWNLRYKAIGEVTPEQRWAISEGFFYKVVDAPLVEPGVYSVQVGAGKGQVTKPVRVDDDPTITISEHDRAIRHEAIMRGYELYKTGSEGDKRFVALKASLTKAINSWKEKDAVPVPESVKKQADDLVKKLDGIAPLFTSSSDPLNPPIKRAPPPVTDRIAHALFNIEGFTGTPRQRDLDQLTELAVAQKDALDQLKRLIDVDLAKLNDGFRDAKVAFVAAPK
jgi:photosystem II stability/assembly factor-like uncharacterized protein